MQRNTIGIKESNENNKFIIPVHEEVTFKDIAKYLDIQMQDIIKSKLEGIDEEVEKLGKVSDHLYKQSYEEYKNILDKEREDLDNNVKKYISNLKDNLIGLRNRINYDYKGKYQEINSKLTKLIEGLKIITKQSIKLQYKHNDLNEDCCFYEKQIDDMKDMNIYLKYKLKLFFGDIPEEDRNQKQTETIDNEINEESTFKNKKLNSIYNENNNIENSKRKKSTNEINEKNKLKNKEEEKNEEDKLYITATRKIYNSNKKKKKGNYAEFDEVEYLNSKLELEEIQLMNYIQHEKYKNSKFSKIYNDLYIKTTNPYFLNLKEIIEEQKTLNVSKSQEKNNLNESSINNASVFPSIYNSTISMSNSPSIKEKKKFYTPENPGPGYITRKENKEIMLNFLENIETKKVIYKLMYGD